MKILFLTNDMRVKHFHMASAIRAKMDAEIHFMYIWPTHRIATVRFSELKGSGCVAHFVNDAKESRVFDTVQRYNAKAFDKLQPSVVYVNDLDGVRRCFPPIAKPHRFKPVCDIEDLAATDIDVHKNIIPLKREHEIISNPDIDMFLFGSQDEYNEAHKVYTVLSRLSSRRTSLVSSRVQYPFVAESTLINPSSREPKTEEFSVVYAGSIWKGGYRDNYSTIIEFGKQGINLDVYLLNSWNAVNWKMLSDIADKYPSINAFPRLKLFEVKQRIQKYHAGLYLTGDFNKVKATYGMKPLEYAYAGVVPVGVDATDSSKPVKNLSDRKPFGYVTPLEEIRDRYWNYNYLKNFDWDYHLMDNHIDEFKELM